MRRPSCRWSSLVHPVASRTIITPIDLSRANHDIAARRRARATIVLTEVIPVWFLLLQIAPAHAFLGGPLQRLAGCYVDVFRIDVPEVATVDRSTEVPAMQPPDGVLPCNAVIGPRRGRRRREQSRIPGSCADLPSAGDHTARSQTWIGRARRHVGTPAFPVTDNGNVIEVVRQ